MSDIFERACFDRFIFPDDVILIITTQDYRVDIAHILISVIQLGWSSDVIYMYYVAAYV